MTAQTRRFTEIGATIVCSLAAIFAACMLLLIIGQIAIGAIPSLNLHYLITPESATYGFGLGIANAIIGSIILSIFSTIFAIPFALCTAIYLKRYAPNNRLTDLIRFFIEVLSGTPSIVVGMFGLLVLVIYLKPFTGGYSRIAGTIALAILIMPVIERAIECAIDNVNPDLEEGSYALGANKWQTIKMITLPTAITGIFTGFILGFGRAAEESSVVILTAGYSQFIPDIAIKQSDKFFFGFKIDPFNNLIATLPYSVYNSYMLSNVTPMSAAYAAALVLITFVLLINLTAKTILWYSDKGKKKTTFGKNIFKKLCNQKIVGKWIDTNPITLSNGSDSRETYVHSSLSEENNGSDWRLAFSQPLPASRNPKMTITPPPVSENGPISPQKQPKPDLGRNEKNRPGQLPWWKWQGHGDTDLSASVTDKDSDSSSLQTASGISGAFISMNALLNRKKEPEPPLKEKLQTDAELAALIRRERELDELFEMDSERALLDRLPHKERLQPVCESQTRFQNDDRLQSLIRKEQELDRFFENNRETQLSNDTKTILYTENDRVPAVPEATGKPGETRFARSGEEMNPYSFTWYSTQREDFSMFEERPKDLPVSNYSVQDHDRWRLMQRNREENTSL